MNAHESRTPPAASDPAESDESRTVRKQLRGSSLLLAGRLIALLLNFVAQILTVRYLTKQDFGALSYALSWVTVGANIGLLGLHKGVTRFTPIFSERQDKPQLAGTIVLALASTSILGVALVCLTLAARNFLFEQVASDPLSVGLLLTVITLAPLQALDSIFQGLFAAFASPKAIFFRRFLLGPALRILAIVVVLIVQGDVYALAWGHLIAGILGLLAYVTMFPQLLESIGIQRRDLLTCKFPFKQLLRFCIPLVSSDLLVVFRSAWPVFLLESYRGNQELADFRAVLPVAGLNLVLLQSVKLLYTPTAARHFGRGEHRSIHELYWQTSAWIVILTFPVFAITTLLADPLTVILFESRYAEAGILLAIVSAANYFNASLGVNTYTLNVFAKVRFIAGVNLFVGALALLMHTLLIPHHGALGAAVATAATIICHNVLNQWGVVRGTGLGWGDRRHLRAYGLAALATAVLLGARGLGLESWGLLILLLVVSFLLLRLTRRELQIGATFPELYRLPFMRMILGQP